MRQTYESRGGSHWGEFSVPPYTPSTPRVIAEWLACILVSPLAILTMLAVLAAMPVLARRDRRRGVRP